MYFLTKVRLVVPISPDKLQKDVDIDQMILEKLRKDIELDVDEKLGLIVAVIDAKASDMGRLLPGSPDVYFDAEVTLLTYKPVKGEIVEGEIREVTQSDVFVNIGCLDARCPANKLVTGDFLRFDAKQKILRARRSKQVFRVGEWLRAKVERYEFSIPIEVGPLFRGPVVIPPRSIRPKSEVRVVLRANEPGLGLLSKIEEERKEILKVSEQ